MSHSSVCNPASDFGSDASEDDSVNQNSDEDYEGDSERDNTVQQLSAEETRAEAEIEGDFEYVLA